MNFLKSIFSNTAYSINSIRRDLSNLRLKMEVFVAKYPGNVINSAIPIGSYHPGINEDDGGPINFYVREEFSSGVTSFVWFHTFEGAAQYIEVEKKRFKENPPDNGNKLIKIVGPYDLPWGKNDRFL